MAIPGGPAHCAEQHGVGVAAEGQGRVWQGIAGGVHGGPADERLLEGELVAEALGDAGEAGHGLRRNLGPHAVAGEDGDAGFHAHTPQP